MILFLDDWNYYPTAYPDFHTTNQSFLNLAKTYKSMGIKNYFFHLALMNPKLKGVDPFDPNLSTELMTDIGTECMVNPWYFFREILRVKPQSAGAPPRFRGDRGNMGLFWCFFNHIDVFLIQPRQTGKSTGADGLAIYILFVGARNTRINMLTKDEKLRVQNVERLKAMRDLLPKYLNHHNKRVDADNSFMLTCDQYGNEYSTSVPRANEDDAANLGRGTTAPITFIDEPPFIKHIKVIVPAMLAATGAAVDEAKEAGALYGNVFTTTAGKKDSESGKYMYAILQNSMVWDERLVFDCRNTLEATEIIKANGNKERARVNLTLSHLQLGKTDAWLREKMAAANSTGEDADRDYLNIWTSGGLGSPLPTEINERIRASELTPIHNEITKQRYVIRWYIPEEEVPARMTNGSFVLGLDTSDAVGKDDISMILVDTNTLEVVATMNINETNIFTFADFIAEFLIKYTKVVLVPERRSTGVAIIDLLLIKLPSVGIDPFRRIYNTIVDDSLHLDRDHEAYIINGDPMRRPKEFYDRYKKFFGFATSGAGRHSRGELYGNILLQGAKMTCNKVRDRTLIDQITALVVKNGRIDHETSGNDDSVIAWLLTIWFLMKSRNLDFYGIFNALGDVTEYRLGQGKEKPKDGYDRYIDQEQKAIKAEMEDILSKLNHSHDEITAFKLETRLRLLHSKLIEVDDDMLSIDTLIKKASEERLASLMENTRAAYIASLDNIRYGNPWDMDFQGQTFGYYGR